MIKSSSCVISASVLVSPAPARIVRTESKRLGCSGRHDDRLRWSAPPSSNPASLPSALAGGKRLRAILGICFESFQHFRASALVLRAPIAAETGAAGSDGILPSVAAFNSRFQCSRSSARREEDNLSLIALSMCRCFALRCNAIRRASRGPARRLLWVGKFCRGRLRLRPRRS